MTICSTISCNCSETELSCNKTVFGVARTDLHPARGDLHELAAVVAEKLEVENTLIEETVDSDNGDYIVYGANLTSLNLDEADIYGLELRKHKPIFAYYSIKGMLGYRPDSEI